MRLTRYTDYAVRVLMYLSAKPEQQCSISEISASYGVSHNHLMKVVHELRKTGFVVTVRGRNGGIRLARPAADISIGEVVRATEGSFQLVDCETCIVSRGCGLSAVFGEAADAFLAVLDGYSFADLPHRTTDFMSLFIDPNGTDALIRKVPEPQS